jgi:L-iditol 2-dehydrogenase
MITGLEQERLETAGKLGADITSILRNSPSVRRLQPGMGVDYVFECTGQPDGRLQWIMFEGRHVVLIRRVQKGTDVTFSAERLHYDEITLKGIFHLRLMT